MNAITFITPEFAVTSALDLEDFALLVELGFRTVINNRPDGEEAGQPSSIECAARALRHGLSYRHIPANSLDLFTDPVVAPMAEALQSPGGPILAHCKSGQRSAIVWAAASARSRPVGDVLQALDTAGFALSFLRDELDSQADRVRWMCAPPPLDEQRSAAAPENGRGRAAA